MNDFHPELANSFWFDGLTNVALHARIESALALRGLVTAYDEAR